MLKAKNRWQVALPVLGHHTGLLDAGTASQNIKKFYADYLEAVTNMVTLLKQVRLEEYLLHFQTYLTSISKSYSFVWCMVSSALVDADFLDTEKHFNPDKQTVRSL